MSITRNIKSLSEADKRVIDLEFKRLNDEINRLKNQPVMLSQQMIKQIEDIARNQAHYHGSNTIGTWKIKDVIRIDADDVRRTTDVVLYRSGELVVRGELIIGY